MAPEKKLWRRVAAAAAWAALFVASFVLCDRLVYTGLRQALARHFASTARKDIPRAAAEGSGDGEALIFGTSRAEQGFDGPSLSAALGCAIRNEAGPGRYPQFHYYYYQSIKARFPAPKAVIYGLDYFMFEKNSTGLGLVRTDRKALLASLSPAGAANPGSAWLSRASWLYRMKPKVDELLVDVLDSARTNAEDEAVDAAVGGKAAPAGLGPRRPRIGPGVYTQKPRRWKKRAYSPFPGHEGAFLKRLVEELDAARVPTFLVFLPEYIGTYETNFEQERFKGDIGRLAAGLKNVHVLDFDYPGAFALSEPSLFWNGGWGYSNSHLNEPGAREFTRELAKAIRSQLEPGHPGER